MTFLYPRTVAIRRPNISGAVGIQPYSGAEPTDETVIATALPAGIQQARARGAPDGGVPEDAPDRIVYYVFIPRRAATLGLIQTRDIVVDDLGNRYVVSSPFWDSLGYKLYAELLQA